MINVKTDLLFRDILVNWKYTRNIKSYRVYVNYFLFVTNVLYFGIVVFYLGKWRLRFLYYDLLVLIWGRLIIKRLFCLQLFWFC